LQLPTTLLISSTSLQSESSSYTIGTNKNKPKSFESYYLLLLLYLSP